MNRQNLHMNKASLISLQAELSRKKEDISKNNVPNENRIKTKLEIKPHLKQQFEEFKKGKKASTTAELPENDTENSVSNDQIKESLRVKAEIYNKLRQKEIDPKVGESFLVNFDDDNVDTNAVKEDYDSDPDSEFVSFTDSLGRTRTCPREDLEYYKSLDTKLKPNRDPASDESTSRTNENEPTEVVSQEILLWDRRREELRKMWDEEEIRMSNKKNIHYQDILFNEARTHGVGYFNFSQDETEREKQQEILRKLREETLKNQQLANDAKERRKMLMIRRLAAANKRKREKLGLPPKPEDDEPSIAATDDSKEVSNETKTEPKSDGFEEKLNEFLNNMKRSTHVRPWDVGKEGVKEGDKKPVLTQNQWNELQRKNRPTEFAPPSSYSLQNRQTKSHSRQQAPSDIEFEYDIDGMPPKPTKSKRTGAEVPPPLSYDRTSTAKIPRMAKSMEEAVTAGINALRNAASNEPVRESRIYSEF